MPLAGAAFQEDDFELIHLAMTAHADQDDLLLAQFQLQRDAILQVDGDGVQPGQTPLQRVQPQGRVERDPAPGSPASCGSDRANPGGV